MEDIELSRLYFEHARTKGGGLTRYGILRKLFEKAWCRETASPGSQAAWTVTNPSYGQCAVSALAVQAMCGGELVRCVVEGFGSHYFNHLVNGEGYTVYDLTRTQFPYGTNVPPGVPVDREATLHSPRALEARTKERYELLKTRLAEAILAS